MTRNAIMLTMAAFAAAFSLSALSHDAGSGAETTDASAQNQTLETAVFAGGCFWCVESDFEKLDGVGDVQSGYSGGALQNPTYRNHEGHLEVAKIPFDPAIISYRELVDYFFRHMDPLDDGGQFCDRGHAYTTAIFYNSAAQKEAAEESKAQADLDLGAATVTPIRELDRFWVAEDYHQDYYKKNPIRYKFYRTSCGRDRRVAKVWGK